MRFLALAVPALAVLTTACSRPEVEAFRRNPPPLEVVFEVPRAVPHPEAVKAEYTAALRARLATRTMVVRQGTPPPSQAVTVRVQITELRPVKGSDPSPGAVGVVTGVAVGTLSALAGNRDAVFDGFFWGLWAGHHAAHAKRSQRWEADRLGFTPQVVEAQVALMAPGNPEPLWVFAVEPMEVINAMDPIRGGERGGEDRILEEEASAFARVVVAKLQQRFGWSRLPEPSYWGEVKPEAEPAPPAPVAKPAEPEEPEDR